MAFFHVVFYFLFFISNAKPEKLNFIIPVHYYEENLSNIYQKSATIILPFFIPTSFQEHLLVTGTNCSSETRPLPEICPIVFHLQNALEQLRPLITFSSTRLTPYNDLLKEYICDEEIRKSFPSEFISKIDFTNFLQNARLCLNDRGMLLEELTNFDKVQDFSAFYTTAHVSYNEVYYPSGPVDLSLEASHAVAVTSLNIAGITHFLGQALQWEHAFSDCKQGQIPISLIDMDAFLKHLIKLQNNLDPTLQFVIPSTSAYASYYYSVKLAECVIIDNEFVVKISIPIKQRNSDLKLISLQAIYFAHQFENNSYVCLVPELMEKKFYTFDKFTKHFVESNCKNGELCYIPDKFNSRHNSMKSCSSVLLSGSIDSEIIRYCGLECYDAEELIDDLIIKKMYDKVYVTGGKKDGIIQVYCNGSMIDELIIMKEGSIMISLPCNCVLVYDNKDIFIARKPCPEVYSIDNILPIQFQKKFNEEFQGFKGFQ